MLDGLWYSQTLWYTGNHMPSPSNSVHTKVVRPSLSLPQTGQQTRHIQIRQLKYWWELSCLVKAISQFPSIYIFVSANVISFRLWGLIWLKLTQAAFGLQQRRQRMIPLLRITWMIMKFRWAPVANIGLPSPYDSSRYLHIIIGILVSSARILFILLTCSHRAFVVVL